MAGTIRNVYETGRTLYVVILNRSAQFWNGSSFETYNASNWATYAVAMTELGVSGIYTATFPAGISAGKYETLKFDQAGGSPAVGDDIVGTGIFEWDGTNETNGDRQTMIEFRLDELVSATAGGTPPTVGSLIDLMMNKNGGQTFDQATDSLESLRDSGTGPTTAQIADAVWDLVLVGRSNVTSSGGDILATIKGKLPTGTISDFDESANSVNLNSNQTGVTVGTVNTLGSSALSAINSEVVDVMSVDVISELSAGIPASNPTIVTALMFLYMALRNKNTTSTSENKVYNNAGSNIAKAQVSDSGSVYTKEQFQAP